MIRNLLASTALAVLVACTPTQLTTVSTDIAAATAAISAACATAQTAETNAKAVVKGGAQNTVANISSYVDGGCADATLVAKLANDPTSLEWVGTLTGALNTLAAAPAS